ncbi:uncharacterized protein E0L32_010131 [Thyridium curvatum]|uniref:Transcription initiation factor TFIID subunit 1 histone acetyltransferase domain-containing protein n=1 Tax=Thyridium curvatum TaxID=1093900 RepID=A0A507AU18_9PEZI|nr:uncharacterized protein E0L32_010131 [Thyridium curvatum]TPX08401.1 hypothetical protein E0L32_010131 [Thyridium curvatum]
METETDNSNEFSSLTDNEEFWKRQTAEDDAEVLRFLDQSQQGRNANVHLNLDPDAEISQEGKADDAEDFGDISDDELPDEEEATGGASAEVPGLTDDTGTSHDTDDLFGDQPSSPIETAIRSSPVPQDDDLELGNELHYMTDIERDRALNFPEEAIDQGANQDPSIPPAAENVLEVVLQAFPTFEKGVVLDFNELLAPKPLFYTEKKPARPPKPLLPTKLSLDFEADQEKLFRIPGTATATHRQKIRDAETKGFVSCLEPEILAQADVDMFKEMLEDDSETIGGFTLRDIELVCEDWDSMIDPPTPPSIPQEPVDIVMDGEDEDDDWNRQFLDDRPVKRRKIVVEPGLPTISRFIAPTFDNFEEATSRGAKRVYLDMQDPYLLIDDMDSERASKRPKLAYKQKRMANGRLGRDISDRFNYSNDQAYDQLKENHQHKVRAQLSNVQVEHSLPAIKLVWPYYTIKSVGYAPHDYHRPSLRVTKSVGQVVKLAKPAKFPRKEMKHKKVRDAFKLSKDLSLNDNSTAILFEYSEEIPTVLSNFGMGNKIMNYYRRKTKDEDEKPPKLELGDNHVLLPEDKSPFSIFGTVDAGETVPTLHNPMFQAPIFKHNARNTDFLFGRSTTGTNGTVYYLRKIDHLYVVGQNFPLAEVPGPHSRKVTALSKNRLRMVAYRLIHRHGSVTLGAITSHVKDSNDAQNRQKLKEFLQYDKETKSWHLNVNESLMDQETIDTMVKPDEVCLVDAMQVGQNELAQNGYQLDDSAQVDDDDGENNKESLANNMVPWKTTKAFIDACSGKAMLQLHGAGDPTGKGLGFSFIKTSMKGGYMDALQGPGTTSADAIERERERKANGGHSYNVKKQEALYKNAIETIWGLQKSTLTDVTDHDDEDVQLQEDEDDRFNVQKDAASSVVHVDDSMSQFSRSAVTAVDKKKLKIVRKYRNPETGDIETKTELVYDQGVITQYVRAKARQEAEKIDPYAAKPTGDPEHDRILMERLDLEQARLNRNKERRHAREKQKAMLQQVHDGDPDSPAPSIEKNTGTTRKCANCGQVGHIKTNKKLCPLLNGTMKAKDGAEDQGGFGTFPDATPVTLIEINPEFNTREFGSAG